MDIDGIYKEIDEQSQISSVIKVVCYAMFYDCHITDLTAPRWIHGLFKLLCYMQFYSCNNFTLYEMYYIFKNDYDIADAGYSFGRRVLGYTPRFDDMHVFKGGKRRVVRNGKLLRRKY
ncbi:MAG: hypothetical protein GY853_13525 [PVC group bacterium]|nr:hypothetical protein [PVC group bacterium]